MAQAPSNEPYLTASPCIVVLLPDGSARLYDDARLTASAVLADFPRHVLLSALSTATPRTPLPPAVLLKPGRTYYLVEETHRPRSAATVSVDVSTLTSPSSSQSPSLFRKSQTLPCTSMPARSPHASSEATSSKSPPQRTGHDDPRSRISPRPVGVGYAFSPVSPHSTLSTYSPSMSKDRIPLECHHGQSRSSPPKAWKEGVPLVEETGFILRTTSTCELRAGSRSGISRGGARVVPSRRLDGGRATTTNRILQELEALDDVTIDDSADCNQGRHSSLVAHSQSTMAGPITESRRASANEAKSSMISKFSQLKSWGFKSRGATGRKMNKSHSQQNIPIGILEAPGLGEDIFGGKPQIATLRQCEEEGTSWINMDDRSMIFTDTQILARRGIPQEDASAIKPAAAAVAAENALQRRVFPRRLSSQVEESLVSDYEQYYSQAFYPKCYNEPIYG